jgi:hypothetical protein
VARATCPAGTRLIGGGHDARLVTNPALGEMVVDDIELNAPDASVANTWQTQAHRGPTRAFALCAP